ncbi:hypothetical protein BC941DRAFT_427711 [Chlamydoabsidia padenii]|nr:hypothetical protein BC941DRAFT_427711 [Chlamydoabsidia padenii]
MGMTMRGALPPPPIPTTQQNQQLLQQHSHIQHHHLLPPPSGTLLPPPSTIALPATPTSTSINSQQNSMNNATMVTGVPPSTVSSSSTMVPLPTVSPSLLVQRQFDALRQRVLEFDHLLGQQQALRNKKFLQVATDAFATAHEMLSACQAHDQQQQRLQHHHHHHLFGNSQHGSAAPSSSSSPSSSSPSPSPSLPLATSKYTIHYNKKGDGLD